MYKHSLNNYYELTKPHINGKREWAARTNTFSSKTIV